MYYSRFSRKSNRIFLRALKATNPSKSDEIWEVVLELARRVKGVPECRELPVEDVRSIFRKWYKYYDEEIQQSFKELWVIFRRAWRSIKKPYIDTLEAALEDAKRLKYPRTTGYYKNKKIKLLIAICYQLSKYHTDRSFFLSCRDAGKLLEVSSAKAWRMLDILMSDEVLECLHKGSLEPSKFKKNSATWYRYLRENR